MSGLSDLLSGEQPAGVYRWASGAAPDEVRRACEEAGWRFGVVDSTLHRGKAGLLRELGRVLDFPAYYGQNLDALHDCLADLATPTLLLWDGWAALARSDPQTYVVAIEVLDGRASTPSAFVVLLRGDGPPIDPPWLEG